MSDTELYLKVTLKSNPATHVWVKTTENKQASKRRAIQRDISFQTFPRWVPFAGQQFSIDYEIRAYKTDKVTPYF